MLVITRNLGERFMIDDEVVVTVLGVKGNQVRLGVKAPQDMKILREELIGRDKDQREAELNHERDEKMRGHGYDQV